MTSPWPWMGCSMGSICQHEVPLVLEPHQWWQGGPSSGGRAWRQCPGATEWCVCIPASGGQKWARFPTSPLAACSSSTWALLFGPRIIITCLFVYNPHPEAWWQSYPGAIVIYYMFSWLIRWVFWPRDIFLAHFLLPDHFKSTDLWFFTNVLVECSRLFPSDHLRGPWQDDVFISISRLTESVPSTPPPPTKAKVKKGCLGSSCIAQH